MGFASSARIVPPQVAGWSGPAMADDAAMVATQPIDLSIVIATLNAGERLSATLAALEEVRETLGIEVIVADSGSTDDTVARAQHAGAQVVTAGAGRGVQLSAGAKEASGRWLLFLQPDATLEPFWSTTVTSFMRGKGNALKAAYFTFALDDASRAARRAEGFANWRARRLGLPRGEQGLLMSRTMYDSLVGYLDLPIMEDVDMARRIGRQNLVELPATATAAAERYRREGYLRRQIKELALLVLYFLGVPPKRLAQM